MYSRFCLRCLNRLSVLTNRGVVTRSPKESLKELAQHYSLQSDFSGAKYSSLPQEASYPKETSYLFRSATLLGASREDRVSLCIPDCPGIHCVDQADLELTEIYLPL